LFPRENLGPVAQVSPPLPVNYSIPQPQGDTDPVSGLSPILDSDGRALQRFISGAVPRGELVSLVENIVSNVKAAAIVERLRGDDAERFVEVMDEVRMFSLASELFAYCLILLYLGAE
jgi:hypothetical protein